MVGIFSAKTKKETSINSGIEIHFTAMRKKYYYLAIKSWDRIYISQHLIWEKFLVVLIVPFEVENLSL